MLVSIAVHAIFLCEQPAGSDDVFPNHPRFSWLCNRVAVATLLNISTCFVFPILNMPIQFCFTKVYRNSFWMMHYGSKSPKRTTVWSVRQLIVGKLALSSDYFISNPPYLWTKLLPRTRGLWRRRTGKRKPLLQRHAGCLGLHGAGFGVVWWGLELGSLGKYQKKDGTTGFCGSRQLKGTQSKA